MNDSYAELSCSDDDDDDDDDCDRNYIAHCFLIFISAASCIN